MKENLLLVVLIGVVMAQGAIIAYLIDFIKKMKSRNDNKGIARKEKGYLEKISDLYEEVERLEYQLSFYKGEVAKWKEKATEYAYAMEDITVLYGKACETITNYIREGLLIRSFSDSVSAYEHFTNTWRDLNSRRFVETYKFNEILNDPQDLEDLFGTSDMEFLSEVFR